MQRILLGIVLGALFAIALPVTGLTDEATNPLFGTWLMDRAKSTFIPAPGPKGQMRTYAPAAGDGEKLTARGIDAEGRMTLVQYTARYDGHDYAITGSSGGDLISLARIDRYTTRSTQKRAGNAVIISTRTVSNDGKTLTVTTKGMTAEGTVIDSVMIFDRH
jgi:hypothetical protein